MVSVPEYMRSAFAANGVSFGDLVFAMHTDMSMEGNFSDVYVAVGKISTYCMG